MKTIKYICTCLLIALMTTSCEDWLTVEPKTLSTKDKMFSTEMGYQTALTGIYLELRSIYTPGSFMMGGNIDIMAHLYPNYSYNYGIETAGYLLYTHQYSGSLLETPLNSLFQSFYKVITNVNVLLDAIQSQSVMAEDMASLIEGEALAIRAFCHAELLRLWGPVPTKASASERYLPYVTEYTTEKYDYELYEDYVEKMMADFNASIELLKQVEPMEEFTNSQLNSSYNVDGIDDDFLKYRQKRFNLYGVKALIARMSLYIGDTETAYKEAKEVIQATNDDGTKKFNLGTVSDLASYNNYDYLFSKEHLVGVDIEEYTSSDFTGRQAAYTTTEAMVKSKLFENQSDTRLQLFATTWMYVYYVYGSMKYARLGSYDSGLKSVPIIRLSEMYLILMETAPLTEANAYYKTFRESRAASYTALTESTRINEVLKEYIREFFSEGQTFFVHKRMNLSSMYMSGEAINADQYRLPLPTNETQY